MTTNVTSGKVLVEGKPAPGIALHGYDAVAYFKGGHPTVGDARIAMVHGDATYRFSSKANHEAFAANPGHYVPQFGGFCAFGASVGAKFDGDPMVWRIVNDKLYVNLSPDIQTEWFKDIPGNITKAETNWVTLADQPA
jgi:hypothetical protein